MIERDVDYYGGDFDYIEDVLSAENCAVLCANHDQCDSWTWGKAPNQSYTNRCYLKNGTPSASSDTCCDSGLKNACLSESPNTVYENTVGTVGLRIVMNVLLFSFLYQFKCHEM